MQSICVLEKYELEQVAEGEDVETGTWIVNLVQFNSIQFHSRVLVVRPIRPCYGTQIFCIKTWTLPPTMSVLLKMDIKVFASLFLSVLLEVRRYEKFFNSLAPPTTYKVLPMLAIIFIFCNYASLPIVYLSLFEISQYILKFKMLAKAWD